MSSTSTKPDLDSASASNPSNSERHGTDAAAVVSLAGVVLAGAIFGFFYAWVCSTMWGLDDADPRVAINAMQAMNASVRNAVFFPAFFLTPVVLGAASILLHRSGRRQAARWFGLGAATYLLGGLVLTMVINVPMNEDLAHHTGVLTEPDAARIWADYSGPWQFWNTARTLASGTALAFAANGLRFLSAGRKTDRVTT